jgi:anti-sigma B factor antagonist
MVPSFEVLTEPSPEGVRVLARGELDLHTAGDVTDALATAEAGEGGAVVLDLSGITFIDSTGLRLIVAASVRSTRNGNHLSIVPSPAVDRVIDLCDIREQLPLS